MEDVTRPLCSVFLFNLLGVLQPRTLEIFAGSFSVVGKGSSVPCRRFRIIPGLYPLDAGSKPPPPQCDNQK